MRLLFRNFCIFLSIIFFVPFCKGETINSINKAKEERDLKKALSLLYFFILSAENKEELNKAYELWKELWEKKIIEEEIPTYKEEIFSTLQEKRIETKGKEGILTLHTKKEEKILTSQPKKTEKEEKITSEEPFIKVANRLYNSKLYEELKEQWKIFIEKFPNSELLDQIYYGMSQLSFLQKDYTSSLEAIKKLEELQIDENSIYKLAAKLLKARILIEEKNFSSAIRELLHLELTLTEVVVKEGEQKILPAPPKGADLLALTIFYLAEAYLKEKLYKEAIAEYSKLIHKYPKFEYSGTAAYNIARIYDTIIEVRDFSSAAEAYLFFFSNYPEHPKAEEAKKRYRFIKENYL